MNTIRPWLSIGTYRDARNLALLQANQISAILHLAERVDHPQIVTCYLPLEDGNSISAASLRQGVDFVLAQQQRGQHVLVACGAGVSRSVSFAIAALTESEGIGLLEAALLVKRHHPDALPHMALWSSLCAYYQEEIPFFTMLGALSRVKKQTE